MLNLLRRLWKEEEGQGMVEYGLIIALISIAVIVILRTVGEDLVAIFTGVSAELEDAASGN